MYWLVGTLSNDLNEISFLAAIINSVGSVGSTFGFVVSAEDVNYNGACAINVALFFVAIPPLAWVVFNKVTNTTHDSLVNGLGEERNQFSSGYEDEKQPGIEVASLKAAIL